MRTLIDLPARMASELDASAKREKISRAEAVRRAIAAYLAATATPSDNDVFGIWRRKKINARAYEDALRNEWQR
jgi:metal-responsive CopG/Arc/MetJ family transcriptional regulator